MFTLSSQKQETAWSHREVTAYQLPAGGGLALKIKMHPKLQALMVEYDRHKLMGHNGNAKNFAIGHVTPLQLNSNRRRAGLPVEG